MRPTMMTYISEEPACLAQILRDYRQKLAPIETFARQHPVRRILLLATGSSLNAALCARYFFEQRFGVLLDIKEPYNFTHYDANRPALPIWWWRFHRVEKARRRWRRCVRYRLPASRFSP
ncbi:glucosamine--fructose-6-phosphate aminotransferase [Klebsiella pneumoniae]|nr:glucosamine--fructose-6-phosphate aminotransferase [Klebsiella pneumoniae]